MATQTATANGSANGAAAMRTKVDFAANVPTTLELEHNDGVESNGRFGIQYRYSFAGNLIAWLDPPVRDAILASGAVAGSIVTITKQQTSPRGRATWKVELCEDEPGCSAPQPRGPAAAWLPQPKPQPAAAAPVAKPPASAAAPAANGRNAQAAAEIHGPQPATQLATAPREERPALVPNRIPASADELALAAALMHAVHAAQTAEDYAAALGYPLKFRTDDIRALGITLLIGAQKGGRA
jgi:hypothetical protein